MKLIVKKPNVDTFFFIFVIYLRFSLWLISVNELAVDIVLVTALLLYQIIKTRKLVLKLEYVEIALVLTAFVLISCVVNIAFHTFDILTIVYIWMAVLFASTFVKNEFCKNYVNAISVIALLSMVGFSFNLFFPEIASNFPRMTIDKWMTEEMAASMRNLFVCVITITTNYERNWGIFYEPGMCALFFNLALFMEMLVNEERNTKKIVIITAGVITTLSTNGLITLVLIYVAYFLQKKGASRAEEADLERKKEKKRKRLIFLFGVVAVCVLILFFVQNPNNWKFFINKLSEYEGVNQGSGFDRFQAIRNSIEAIKSDPIVGQTMWKYTENMRGQISTFTPLQWFSYYGIFFGLLVNFGFAMFSYRKADGILTNFFRCAALYTLIVSQNCTQNILVLVIILYSLGERVKKGDNK